MNKEFTEPNKTELIRELGPLAKALSESEYPDISLYEESDTFTGICDGQVYDSEVSEIQKALLSTGVIEEDDLMPIQIEADIKYSSNVSYPKRLKIRCILSDCWEFSFNACYSNDFKSYLFPVLFIKYSDEKEQSAQLTPAWESLFEVEKDIFMRRLSLGGKIRPRVKYMVS